MKLKKDAADGAVCTSKLMVAMAELENKPTYSLSRKTNNSYTVDGDDSGGSTVWWQGAGIRKRRKPSFGGRLLIMGFYRQPDHPQ